MKTTLNHRWPRNDAGGYTRDDKRFRLLPLYFGCTSVQAWQLESVNDKSTRATYDRLADAKLAADHL